MQIVTARSCNRRGRLSVGGFPVTTVEVDMDIVPVATVEADMDIESGCAA